MVKHILFVKMKDNSIEQCEKVKALFLSMKEQIPFLGRCRSELTICIHSVLMMSFWSLWWMIGRHWRTIRKTPTM